MDPEGPSSATVACGCGREHADGGAHLIKSGWQSDGRGGAALLAHCPCGSTVAIRVLAGASFCSACRRLLCDEVKAATDDGVFCVPCARRRYGQVVRQAWQARELAYRALLRAIA